MDDKREHTQGNATHKNGAITTKRKIQNQMDKPNSKGYRNEKGKLGRETRKQEKCENRHS